MTMTKQSDRLNDIPVSEHFRLREFECRCCHRVLLSPRLLFCLEALRAAWGCPILITSGYRCEEHNRRSGGVPRSLHMVGQAADILVSFPEQPTVERLANGAGFDRIVPYGRRNFMHLSVG